eukprot:6295973-Karenia_brevis.AAC.1
MCTLPPLLIEIWRSIQKEAEAVWIDRALLVQVLEERNEKFACRKVKAGDFVPYVITGTTDEGTFRVWAGLQKAGPRDGEKRAYTIAEHRVWGIPGRHNFKFHFSAEWGTDWVKCMKRETVRLYVVDVVKTEEAGLKAETDWALGLTAALWGEGIVTKARPQLKHTPVKGSFFSKFHSGETELHTVETLLRVWGPEWRDLLIDEQGVWMGELKLLWLHVKALCFKCEGPLRVCGGVRRCNRMLPSAETEPSRPAHRPVTQCEICRANPAHPPCFGDERCTQGENREIRLC